MNRTLLLVSVLLTVTLLAVPISGAFAASGRVPALNVRAICKTRDADAKLFRSTTGQSIDECVHDEEAAKQQLDSLWNTTASWIRSRCESEGHSLGTTSYLDLVTCIQMADELKNAIGPAPKKKAAKD